MWRSGAQARGDNPKENKVMAFKVQELMVNVMSGKAGMTGMLQADEVSTCMTRTISGVNCVGGSVWFGRSREVPQARLALLRQELRTAVARA
jgi:hypothetical protein